MIAYNTDISPAQW